MTELLQQLTRWQRWEWLYSALRNFTGLLLATGLLTLLWCAIDYWCDGSDDTPYWVRRTLSVSWLSLVVAGIVFAFVKIRPPSLDTLASRAEEEHEEVEHRFVTALQLNRPQARTEGMSAELIQNVTAEAETLSRKMRLSRLIHPQRLWHAFYAVLALLLLGGTVFAFNAPLALALLQRLGLADVPIPRSVTLFNETKPLHPAGDTVPVLIRASGRIGENHRGSVSLRYDDGRTEDYPLLFQERLSETDCLFRAEVPAASEPFQFRARLRDGRLHEPGAVRFAPRPVVTGVTAYVLAPSYVDPEGQRRYEKLANQAEVACHPDCGMRVVADCSHPVQRGWLIFTGRGQEKQVALSVLANGLQVTGTCDVPTGFNAYRIEVEDENGFRNLTPPRRGLTLLPDRAPLVVLNDEVLMPGWETGPLDDYEVRGMPLVIGGQIQVGYTARSNLGIEAASVVYRVNDGSWTEFPLKRVEADEEKVGMFRAELGVFSSYDVAQNVEFYPLPSPDPESEAPGLVAGGRYNFLTASLEKVGANGQRTKLELGDRVEFRVSVYDRKPGKRIEVVDLEVANRPLEERQGLGRPAGYSESRIKTVESPTAFELWLEQKARSRERLRDIEQLQRGVFGAPETNKP